LSIPNFITIGRILLVPVLIWAIGSDQMRIAFVLFIVAGFSDAVDGFLAKRFNMASELGALLDPLADKVLLVSMYIALGIANALPQWLVILVVSRDILIIGGVLLSWIVNKPIAMKPHYVSKLNTAAQIILVALVLGLLGLELNAGWLVPPVVVTVACLTLLSAALYVAEWIRHMGLVDSRT
jgi:cardiolipin synthase